MKEGGARRVGKVPFTSINLSHFTDLISRKETPSVSRVQPDKQTLEQQKTQKTDIMDALIVTTHEYVKTYMAKYDSSHDYNHILRVLSLAQQILAAETSTSGTVQYNPTVVTLLALLHDVGDKKYSPVNTGAFGPAEEFLLTAGCDPALATTVQKLISNVSYSHERANPEVVAEMCREHPELAVVQDADRLDAIGAVGVGRAFTFGAAKRPGEGMGGVIDHFEDKLLKLEEGMKTGEGRRLAKVRAERIRLFRDWWIEETGGEKDAVVV